VSSVRPTSAILLVGGFGTRLAPLTAHTPKPMLHVAGVPFTEHQIAKARAAGITEIVLATSYLSEVFEPHFGDGEKFGIKISYAVEEKALGTGGAIRNAADRLTNSGPVVIFNGDVLSSHDLGAQIEMHMQMQAGVTLYLTRVADPRAYGVVELDDKRILTFNEKTENPATNIINAGCYIFNRDVIAEIPSDRVVSVERETFPRLLARGALMAGFIDDGYWLDIGTPPALLKATGDLIAGVAQSSAFDELLETGEFELTHGSMVAKSAKIAGSAQVLPGTFIGNGVQVGEGAVINRSILGEKSVVEPQVWISESFLAPQGKIPAGNIGIRQFFGFFG